MVSVILVPRFFLLLFSARFMDAKVIKNLRYEQIFNEKISFYGNFCNYSAPIEAPLWA